MPSKDKKVVGAKINSDKAEQIEKYATTHNITIAAIFSLCIDSLISGEIEIEKGELKTVVNPIESREKIRETDREGIS